MADKTCVCVRVVSGRAVAGDIRAVCVNALVVLKVSKTIFNCIDRNACSGIETAGALRFCLLCAHYGNKLGIGAALRCCIFVLGHRVNGEIGKCSKTGVIAVFRGAFRNGSRTEVEGKGEGRRRIFRLVFHEEEALLPTFVNVIVVVNLYCFDITRIQRTEGSLVSTIYKCYTCARVAVHIRRLYEEGNCKVVYFVARYRVLKFEVVTRINRVSSAVCAEHKEHFLIFSKVIVFKVVSINSAEVAIVRSCRLNGCGVCKYCVYVVRAVETAVEPRSGVRACQRGNVFACDLTRRSFRANVAEDACRREIAVEVKCEAIFTSVFGVCYVDDLFFAFVLEASDVVCIDAKLSNSFRIGCVGNGFTFDIVEECVAVYPFTTIAVTALTKTEYDRESRIGVGRTLQEEGVLLPTIGKFAFVHRFRVDVFNFIRVEGLAAYRVGNADICTLIHSVLASAARGRATKVLRSYPNGEFSCRACLYRNGRGGGVLLRRTLFPVGVGRSGVGIMIVDHKYLMVVKILTRFFFDCFNLFLRVVGVKAFDLRDILVGYVKGFVKFKFLRNCKALVFVLCFPRLVVEELVARGEIFPNGFRLLFGKRRYLIGVSVIRAREVCPSICV